VADKYVQVSQAELDKIAADIGLPAGSSMEAMLARAAELRGIAEAQKSAQKVAASQQQLVYQDKRLVNAAINDGRLTLASQQFWVDALGRDRAANRALLASLAPGLPPAHRIAEDESLETTHNAVMGRLGLAAAPDRRQVAASVPITSAHPPTPPPAPRRTDAETDEWGFPVRRIPDLVLTQRGKPVSEYTHDDHYAVFAEGLGLAFRRGAPPVPKQDAYYQGGLNDLTRPVIGADGVATHFEANPNYMPGY